MIFNCNLRFIGVNFSICMYYKIPKDCGALFQQQVLVYVHNSFYDMGLCDAELPRDVLTGSVMSIFIFSRMYYRTTRN